MKHQVKCAKCGHILKPRWKPCANCGEPPPTKHAAADGATPPTAEISKEPEPPGPDVQAPEPSDPIRGSKEPIDVDVTDLVDVAERIERRVEHEPVPEARARHPPAPAPPPSFAEPAQVEPGLVVDERPCEWCGSNTIERYDDYTARCPACRRSFQWADPGE